MIHLLLQLLGLSISGILFISVSIKYHWSRNIWLFLNKKIKPKYNASLWIVFAGILNILVQLLFQIMGLHYNEILMSIILGFYFAFMPNVDKRIPNE